MREGKVEQRFFIFFSFTQYALEKHFANCYQNSNISHIYNDESHFKENFLSNYVKVQHKVENFFGAFFLSCQTSYM